ncbi:MAG: class A beta-lactamase-related serine hydrolase [bacterium]|nr:class A beta-lactamase-related serine hydrolase [bacterium]
MSIAYYQSPHQINHHHSLVWFYYLVLLSVALLGSIFATYNLTKNSIYSSPISYSKPPISETNIAPLVEINEPEIIGFDENDILSLNKVVKEWGDKQYGEYTISITDVKGYPMLVDDGDKSWFSASVYKLFVAYVAYQYIEDGRLDPGMSNCLEQMIVVSSNYCGRLLRSTIGPDVINSELRKHGINNTDLNLITTSSNDMATVTKLIWNGVDLTPNARKELLHNMDTQHFTGAFQSGFKKAEVYDKIGCCYADEYTDAAIIVLPDERVLMISIMTDGIFSWNIHRLGEQIENALVK